MESHEPIKSIRMPPHVHERLRSYADENSMSVSEATRIAMEAFAEGGAASAPRPKSKRVTIWIHPDDFLAFTRRAKKSNVTQAAALEQGLDVLVDSL